MDKAPESADIIPPSEVIYQIYPASFRDSGTRNEAACPEGTGFGDLKGITEKLDYIKQLGVDAIWISPFFLSPSGEAGDGGYAISDYRAIDPRFGTLDDFKELLEEAHTRGLRVYTDFVLCHTSNEHEWFKASRDPSHPDHERYKDFYVWSDAKHGGGVPNNWQSVFNGKPAWTFDQNRGQYYLHHFNNTQPALNLNHPDVQKASLAEMKFWLDMGVDGLRIDALPFANYDPQLRDNPRRSGENDDFNRYWGAQQFEHSMCQRKTESEVLPGIRGLADGYHPPKRLVVEAIAGPRGGDGDVEQAVKYLDPQKGAHSAYTNALVRLFYSKHGESGGDRYPPWREVYDTIELIGNSLGNDSLNNLGNHDFPRFANRFTSNTPTAMHAQIMKQLFFLTASLPGSLCIYNGDELGLGQASKQDLKGIERDLVEGEGNRDGCRTPMPWKAYEPNMGFSLSDEPYLPTPESHRARAVDVQERSPDSMLNVTRRVLEQRKANTALLRGKMILLETAEPIIAFVRETEDQAVLCAFNFSGVKQRFIPSECEELRARPELLQKLGLEKEQEICLSSYGSSFHGLNQELEKKRREIGLCPASSDTPLAVGVRARKSLFAADLLIQDIHLSGDKVESVLDSIIASQASSQNPAGSHNESVIARGGKATINKEQLTLLLTAAGENNQTIQSAGGATACTLRTLKKLMPDQLDVAVMGFASEDSYGQAIKDFLQQSDIQQLGEWPEELKHDEKNDTAVSVVIRHADGRHTILTYPGHEIEAFHHDRESLRGVPVESEIRVNSDVVYLPESTLGKFGLSFLQHMLRWRWENKKELVLTLPTQASFGADDIDRIRHALPSCNVVMGNDVEFLRVFSSVEKERSAIMDADINTLVETLQSAFKQEVLADNHMPCSVYGQVALITRGEQGAVLVTKDKCLDIAPAQVDTVRNRLGAGYAAFAGFLAGYMSGLPHEESARLAVGFSQAKIQHEGPEPYLIDPIKDLNTLARRTDEMGQAANMLINSIKEKSPDSRLRQATGGMNVSTSATAS